MHRTALSAVALSFVLVCAALAGGCVRQVFSPPAGYPALEGPERLDEGKQTIGGSFGVGGVGLGADIAGGNVKYRRGLGAVEVQAEGAVVGITEKSKADTFPAILSARVGLKGHLVPDFEHLSWTAGVGFGGSAGGVFGATDLGLVLGWVNPYVTPYIGFGGVLSLPFTSNDVDITKAEDDETFIDHPVTSGGVMLSLGVAVNIGASDARLNLGFAKLKLWDIHGVTEDVSAFSLGFAVPL
jgi:hypothetical protein